MKFKNITFVDKVLLSGALVVGGAVCYVLANEHIIYEYLSLSGRSIYEKIGVVSSKDKDVRRRMGNSFSWLPLQSKETLYELDTIFSGQSSEVRFTLTDAGDFILNENSLIVLYKSGGDFLLDIQKGGLVANLSGNTDLQLQTGNKLVKLKSQNKAQSIRLNRDRDNSLKVFSQDRNSKVDLNYDGKAFLLDGAKEVSFGKTGMAESSKPIILETPANEQRILVKENKPLSLNWSSDAHLDQTGQRKVQVATDSDFRTVVSEQPANNVEGKVQLALPVNQKYYWRVVEEGASKSLVSLSGVNQFYAIDGSAPKHVFPTIDYNLHADYKLQPGEVRSVNFKWQKIAGIYDYVVQVSKAMEFTDLVKEGQSTGNSLQKVKLESGIYYWRVRGVHGTKIKSLWSQGTRFFVGEGARSTAPLALDMVEPEMMPELEAPVNVPEMPDVYGQKLPAKAPVVAQRKKLHILKFKGQNNSDRDLASLRRALINPPKFRWKTIKNASFYQLQISKSKNMKKMVVDRKLPGLGFQWTTTRPGDYYWRVRATNKMKVLWTPYSKLRQISVRVKAPKLTPVPVQTRQVQSLEALNAKSNPVKLNWTPRPYSKDYELTVKQVAPKKQLIVSKRMTASNYNLVMPGPGEYVATVAAIGKNGKRASGYSVPETIKYKTLVSLKTPIIRVPDDNTVMVSFSDSVEPIIFDWKSVKLAKKYRLQFSLSSNFGTILLEKSLTKTQFLLTKSLNSSKVYWRIRAESGDFSSPWTAPRSFGYQTVQN